mgnify:CR=1 FL=1
MGYTSGVAEKLYKSFEDGTYLTIDTYGKIDKEDALKKFDGEYGADEDSAKDFIERDTGYVNDVYYSLTMSEMTDGTYRVEQSDADFVEGLMEGGYYYDLTPNGEEKQLSGEELEEDDFNYIRLGVAGERMGDISVWYDLINDTVGGRDFADKSVSQFTYQIDDYLATTLDNLLYEINHN